MESLLWLNLICYTELQLSVTGSLSVVSSVLWVCLRKVCNTSLSYMSLSFCILCLIFWIIFLYFSFLIPMNNGLCRDELLDPGYLYIYLSPSSQVPIRSISLSLSRLSSSLWNNSTGDINSLPYLTSSLRLELFVYYIFGIIFCML